MTAARVFVAGALAGRLVEGCQLEALLRRRKLDRGDRFGQLPCIGGDTVGAVTVEAEPVEAGP